MSHFDYEEAFSRNIGFLTQSEQQTLKNKKVAIAGMGGVGGIHLLTLTRLGVGAFAIADFDEYELANFNRQFGANMKTLDQAKAQTMAQMALDINPDLKIEIFDKGITDHNMDDFLKDVDLFVDGFDFFVLDMRAKLFKKCHEQRIPAITAAPLGMSSAYLIFHPDGMSFEDYFQLEGKPQIQQYVCFLLGLAPKRFQADYVVVPSKVDLAAKKGPSTAMGCLLCAGIAGSEALKLLLGRGPLYPAPYYHQFDAYLGRWSRGYCPGGNKNPLRRIQEKMAYKYYNEVSEKARLQRLQTPAPQASLIETLLDDARWAPSGDNEQPWRFEILDDDNALIHFAHTPDNVIEFNGGEPIYVTAGVFIETLDLSARHHGKTLHWKLKTTKPDSFTISIQLKQAKGKSEKDEHLYEQIRKRSVNRHLYKRTALPHDIMKNLEDAAGPDWTLKWHTDLSDRLELAKLTAKATDIRLRVSENYNILARIIDWDNILSPHALPSQSLGVSAPTRKSMSWMLKKPQQRIDMINKWMGTAGPQLELDILPALFSGAFFTMSPADPQKNNIREDRNVQIAAGRAVQRLWLEASHNQLSMQPSYAVIVFSHYGATGEHFSKADKLVEKATMLNQKWEEKFQDKARHMAFMGRLGYAQKSTPVARSVRLELEALIIKDHRKTPSKT